MSSYRLLNVNTPSAGNSPDTQAVAARLRQGINALKGSFFDLETGHVNYAAMKGSDAYGQYVAAAADLAHLDLSHLHTQHEKLAFWINLYNALTVHGIIALDIRESVREQRDFFKTVAYQVGEYSFSLDDIEHGILRRNQKRHLFARPVFKTGDARLQFLLETPEPRIHFTLVCGSKSCPPIGTYQVERIEQQLEMAAGSFINSENVQVDIEAGRLGLSKIFQWYGKDFGDRRALIQFLARYRRNREQQEWLSEHGHRAKIDWLPYDWGLNH